MRILTHPNPALRQRAEEVDTANDATLRDLAKDMAVAMQEAPGVGLAAPQVGVLKRVIVIDVDERLAALCNPLIMEASEETSIEDEGCLSLPGISVPIERPVRVVCEGLTITGKNVHIEAEGFLARVLQHEIDHLDGMLIIDRATPEERKAAIRRYNEACAAEESTQSPRG